MKTPNTAVDSAWGAKPECATGGVSTGVSSHQRNGSGASNPRHVGSLLIGNGLPAFQGRSREPESPLYIRVDAAHAQPPYPTLEYYWQTSVGWQFPSSSALPSSSEDPNLNSQSAPSPNHGSSPQVSSSMSLGNTVEASAYGANAPLPQPGSSLVSSDASETRWENVDPRDELVRHANPLQSYLAEAAHDIRSPIVAARQLVSTVIHRAEMNNTLGDGDIHLLTSAKLRMDQAAAWAEGVLLDRNLEYGDPVSIRSRFYVGQWLAVTRPLLECLAKQRSAKINWVGWDRSLPRLYLDPNQLTRIVLNLVTNALDATPRNGEVSIRIDAQKLATERVIIAIEDQGDGLPPEMLKLVNASRWDFQTRELDDRKGIGLRTAKRLIRSMGGAMWAQLGPSGGTVFRLSFPVDNRQSLICGWLKGAANRILQSYQEANSEVLRNGLRYDLSVHAIRTFERDTEVVDRFLQRLAANRAFVYRLDRSRWLWVGIGHEPTGTSGGPTGDRQASHDTTESSRQSAGANHSGEFAEFDLRTQQILFVPKVPLHGLACTSGEQYTLTRITERVNYVMRKAIGHRTLPLDDLTERLGGVQVAPFETSLPNLRADGAHANIGEHRATAIGQRQSASRDPAHKQVRPQDVSQPKAPLPQPATEEPLSSNATPESVDPQQTLAELAAQWGRIQDRMQEIRDSLTSSVSGGSKSNTAPPARATDVPQPQLVRRNTAAKS